MKVNWRFGCVKGGNSQPKYVMARTTISTRNHRILAYIEVDARGVHQITDRNHRTLGFYDPRTNRTTDQHKRIVAYGYALPRLLRGDLDENGQAGISQPEPPLSPAQTKVEAERRAKVQQRVRDAQVVCKKKVQDLRSQL